MKVIIIEDEPLMAEALEEEIRRIDPSIQLIARLNSVEATIDHLSRHGFPDLFFSDIELTDGLSFEIFRRVRNHRPIVFCTAYDHYALEAFSVHGIDYILKPFSSDAIRRTIQKYRTFFPDNNTQHPDWAALMQHLSQQQSASQKAILWHRGEYIIPMNIDDIALAQLSNGQVYVYTFSGDRRPVQYNLETLAGLLGPDFYRINRQFIINRRSVKSVAHYFARKLLIHSSIEFKEPLVVSKAGASAFLQWLETG